MADQEKEFRGVVVSLSESLGVEEMNKLVYTNSLPIEYNDKRPLTVLQLMHNRDLFSATKPDRLVTLMKEINRQDLAKIVEKYARKTRKGTKSRAQLDSGTAVAEVESDSSLFVSLMAKLEVTSIQSDITGKALDETLKTVKATPLKRVEEIVQDAKAQADKLRNLVLRAQHLYHLSRSTPQSNGNIFTAMHILLLLLYCMTRHACMNLLHVYSVYSYMQTALSRARNVCTQWNPS